MFTSLKSRLWLTYALMITIVLGSVGIGVLLSIRKSPLIYRQQLSQLEAIANTAIDQINTHPEASLESILSRESVKSKIRMAIYSLDGLLVFDSNPILGDRMSLSPPMDASAKGEVRFINDRKNKTWLYTLQPVNEKAFLLAATPLPRLPLLLILRDELFKPFLRAGFAAMLLAIALAVILGNWVEAPLIKLAQQAEAVTRGDAKPIPIEGPAEVRQLSGTFNEMVTKLNSSQQSQRDFIANVSHELKTPLTSIQGFAQAILDQKQSASDDTRQSASIILEEAHRMNKLVNGLLVLARLDAGIAESRKESIDLAALLQNVLERLTPQAQSAQVVLSAQIEDAPALTADAESLTQVFVNLIDNAIKYSKKGGTVLVTCRHAGSHVEVHVRDKGVGIPRQYQSRIFERFYQVDRSRRGGEKRSVGLGLAIASQLVRSMGGSISVDSEPGKGSDFMVKIPLE